jgi:hypothetical protein
LWAAVGNSHSAIAADIALVHGTTPIILGGGRVNSSSVRPKRSITVYA